MAYEIQIELLRQRLCVPILRVINEELSLNVTYGDLTITPIFDSSGAGYPIGVRWTTPHTEFHLFCKLGARNIISKPLYVPTGGGIYRLDLTHTAETISSLYSSMVDDNDVFTYKVSKCMTVMLYETLGLLAPPIPIYTLTVTGMVSGTTGDVITGINSNDTGIVSVRLTDPDGNDAAGATLDTVISGGTSTDGVTNGVGVAIITVTPSDNVTSDTTVTLTIAYGSFSTTIVIPIVYVPLYYALDHMTWLDEIIHCAATGFYAYGVGFRTPAHSYLPSIFIDVYNDGPAP